MGKSLILSRFYHGCTNVTLHGRTGLVVAGGRGNERNTSSTVEIFMLEDAGKEGKARFHIVKFIAKFTIT